MARASIIEIKDPSALREIDTKLKTLVKLRDTLLKDSDDFFRTCPCQRMNKYKKGYGRTFDALSDNDCKTHCKSKNGNPSSDDTCQFGTETIDTYKVNPSPSPSPSVRK